MKVAVLNAPSYFLHSEAKQINEDTNAVLQFVQFAKEIKPEIILEDKEALVWIAFPKKSSNIPTDMSRESGWSLFEENEWLPVRQVAIDDNWSALRFRPRSAIKEVKRNTDYPGIDREKKSVEIPKDFKQAMRNAHVLAKFETLAFSHRKEYVISILDAKKPETRERRIQKNIEMISKL